MRFVELPPPGQGSETLVQPGILRLQPMGHLPGRQAALGLRAVGRMVLRDGRLHTRVWPPRRNQELAVKGLGVDMGKAEARYLGAAEVRWRFPGGRIYALGTSDTLLFSEAKGALRMGAFASVGLGVDHAR